MQEDLISLLADSTMRIDAGDNQGTGFFVAPGLIVTCKHVVWDSEQDEIFSHITAPISQSEGKRVVTLELAKNGIAQNADLALLQIVDEVPPHPCVAFLSNLRVNDDLYAYGFTSDFPDGMPATFRFEGHAVLNGQRFIQQKEGEAFPGLSGSPLLNLRTSSVCGVLNASRQLETTKGAFSIPAASVFQQWPHLRLLQERFHQQDNRWASFLPLPHWLKLEQERKEILFRSDLEQHASAISSPLEPLWQAFLNRRSWHDEIERNLTDAKIRAAKLGKLVSLPPGLEKIEAAGNYERIVGELRGVVPQALVNVERARSQVEAMLEPREKGKQREHTEQKQWLSELHRALRFLSDQTLNPSFGKLFLALGTMGSGRTHFLHSLLSGPRDLAMDKPLILHIDAGKIDPGQLHDFLLAELKNWTCQEWPSLAEFDSFLAEAAPRRKLLVAIDNIHRILRLRRAFLDELDSLVRHHTQLHHLFWLLTLDHSSYHSILDHQQFWRDYSWLGRETGQQTPHAGGWIVLDALNLSEKTGVKIIDDVLSPTRAGPSKIELALGLQASAVRQLSHPFVAWAFLDTPADNRTKIIGSLIFTEFVERYWRNWVARQCPDTDLQSQIEECVDLVAQVLLEPDPLSSPAGLLPKKISKQAVEWSELRELASARKAIELLEDGGLLRKTAVGNSDSAASERYDVAFESFWEYRVARLLMKDDRLIQHKAPEFQRRLLELQFNPPNPLARDGVFGFLLLLLDRWSNRGKKDTKIAEEMWTWAATNDEVRGDGVWLAAPKASTTIQRALALLLTSGDQVPVTGRRELFNILYFLTESAYEAVSWPERFRWLRPHYKGLAESALTDYFMYSAARVLNSISDMPTAVAAIPEFEGSEIMGIAQGLAQASVATMIRLREDAIAILPDVLELAGRFDGAPSRHNTDARWVRTHFYEWFFLFYCEELLSIARIEAYDMLSDKGWYVKNSESFAPSVSLAMRREANLAFGHWYRTRAKRDEKAAYVELVAELVGGGDLHEMENAFFLIRHSVAIGAQKAFPVDEEFLPHVRRIAHDTRLSWIHHAFPEFFRTNV